MIHRAICGSMERFIGILLEHHAGHLPLWLAPVQIVVCTITSDADDAALAFAAAARKRGLRVETDLRNEKINYKVREHSLAKVPVLIALGRKEASENTVSRAPPRLQRANRDGRRGSARGPGGRGGASRSPRMSPRQGLDPAHQVYARKSFQCPGCAFMPARPARAGAPRFDGALGAGSAPETSVSFQTLEWLSAERVGQLRVFPSFTPKP